jgi:hypothetical protein
MDSLEHPVDRAFGHLEQRIQAQPVLRAELARAQAEFGSGPPPSEHDARLWMRRVLEWFLLERTSEALPLPPFADLLEASGPEDELRAAAASLRASLASVFEVTGVETGQGLWLRDLATRGEYPASEAAASTIFRRGDLIAGRIFPLADGSWHVSRAAAFYRSRSCSRPCARTSSARAPIGAGWCASRRSSSSACSSAGERHQRRSGRRGARAVRARRARERGDRDHPAAPGRGALRARAAPGGSRRRAGRDPRPAGLRHQPGPRRARQLLIHAWSALSAGATERAAGLIPRPEPKRSGALDVQRAMAEFERRRRAGMSIERAFRELEADLDLEGAAGEDEDDDAPAPDFPGVVAAVIEEYLWESSAHAGAAPAEARASVRAFGRFASYVGVFENLATRDLLAYTCHWLPEQGELENADAAREHLAELGRFCRWVEENQGLDLHEPFRSTLRGLESSLPRIVEANRRRTRSTDPAAGELFECLELANAEHVRLRDRGGHERAARLDPELGTWLRPGDHLRGNVLPDGRVAVYCCYPPEARELTRA